MMEKHCIHTVKFDFRMQNEAFARALYGRWDTFFARNFERVADEVFSKHDIASETIEIEYLPLDLGVLTEEDFDEKFPVHLRENLEKSLLQYIRSPRRGAEARRTPAPVRAFELLKYFLLHGSLPWSASGKMRDIHYLLDRTLKESRKLFKQFLQAYGHYTSLQERLACQFSDAELGEGVRLLTSTGDGDFICSYVRFLQAKYRQMKQPEVSETSYRNAIWLTVYSYLLAGRSSYFNRKMFVVQTIVRLSAKYNAAYEKMLELITHGLQNFSVSVPVPPELFLILMQLQEELSEKRWKASAKDAAGFYKMIYALLKKETEKHVPLTDDSRKALIAILSRVDTCREFLQQTSEPEIIRLIPVVAPTESELVIETARSLDEQKNTGALQGKAGGEFRLLKWQIIFPVLFECKGAGFNRKYFVQNVFRKISDHYNVEMALLLDYFCNDLQAMGWMSRELKEIIHAIGNEEAKGENALPRRNSRSGETQRPDSWTSFCEALRNKPGKLREIIAPLSEEVLYEFAMRFFPAEGEFIVAYVRHLNGMPETEVLQGKAGSGFREVKWIFVFTVLNKMPESSFDRRYFVSETLHGLAAHYNMAYMDLLSYFQVEQTAQRLPFLLLQVLDGLYRQEKTQWVDWALKSGKESDRLRLLFVLVPSERKFVGTYVRALDVYRSKNLLQGKTSGSFTQIKWKLIFDVLLEMQHVAFNKKFFVARTLRQLAAHYNLSFREMLEYTAALTGMPDTDELAEINHIIRDLYSAEVIRSSVLPENKPLREMIAQLPAKFVRDAESILHYLPELCDIHIKVHGNAVDAGKLKAFLLELSKRYLSLSRAEIIRQMLRFFELENTCEIKNGKLIAKGEEMEKDEMNSKKNNAILKKENESTPDDISKPTLDFRFVNNAGVVLLSPYLPRLFEMLELTEKDSFKSSDAQIRALFLIQHIVFGTSEFPETELLLNKLLTGLDAEIPIPSSLELSNKEKDAVHSMLQGVLSNWEQMKNTSTDSFRAAFLQREGKLEETDACYLLTLEEKAYDLLLDTCPWGFKTIKYRWMGKMIQVKWR
jgi:hypothetical protein